MFNKLNDNFLKKIILKMSKKFNPWKRNFTKKPSNNISEPTIFMNHNDYCCIDSTIIFPNLERFIQAAFIDPGKVSCAIRIVRYYLISNKIELIWFGIHNFGVGIEQIITGVEKEIEPIKEKLKFCHHIVIESQFMKNEVNFRTFQHMISHIESLIRNQGLRPIIFEVDIALKTVFIGGPRNKSQNKGIEIKKWSREKARKELLNRRDYVSLSIIQSSLDKQDEDLCDAFCYEFGWISYLSKIKHLLKNIEWLYKII